MTGPNALPPKLDVLIADDIGGSRQLLASLLRQLAPVNIHEVSDGAKVVERHRELQPHLTFLDIGLPNKSGLDVLREIRARDDKAFVVIVSAEGRSEVITEAISLCVNGFVVKPFQPKRIVDALLRYRSRALAQGEPPSGTP